MTQTPVPIAGQPTRTGNGVDIRNPFSGELVATVPLCGAEEVDRACRGAAAVFARGGFAQHRRIAVLEGASRALAERAENLARQMTRESAKPIRMARAEVGRAVDTLAFSAACARDLCGEMVAAEASEAGAGKLAFALRLPIGPIAAITPFNFPINLVAHKIGPAIAAGCPVILKPAPQTPLSAIALVDLLVEQGMPADWISVVTDRGKEAAEPLVAHDIPRLVTFTGSSRVGWAIAAAAPRKRVALELGSNAPVIVDADADLVRVAAKVKVAAFAGAGQSCISVQRIIAHADIHDRLRDLLAAEIDTLVCGDPAVEATDVGPPIRAAECERYAAWIAEACERGGRVIAGGRADGRIFLPTLVDDVPVDSRLWREEVFGPVVGMRTYETFEEALALANHGTLKLHAGIFTRDIGKALAAARHLDFGGVLINNVPTFRLDQQPYGGIADGGNTREGPAHAIREMTDLRFVSLEP